MTEDTTTERKLSASEERDAQFEKPRLSPSKVTSYQMCGYAWYRSTILKDYRPPGIAAAQGSGIHGAAQVNFSQKIETHEDRPKAELLDVAVASFEQDIENRGVLLTPEEESKGKSVVIGEAKDRVVAMATVFADEQAPDYQPALVEEYVRIPIESSSHDLSGQIDLLTDDWRVRDFKTAGARKSQKDAETSFQLLFYGLATYVRTGKKAKDVGLDVTVHTKSGKSSRQLLTFVPTAADFRTMVARMNVVIDGIDKGNFQPAPVGHWKCSAKWCGYAATDDCPYYVPERDPTSKKYAISMAKVKK